MWVVGDLLYAVCYACVSYATVVCLPRLMEEMGRLQFSDLFTELPVPQQEGGHFNVFKFIYIILSTTVSFQDAILFLQCLVFFSISIIFLQVHFACVLCLTSFGGLFSWQTVSMPFDLMIVLPPQTLITRISN